MQFAGDGKHLPGGDDIYEGVVEAGMDARNIHCVAAISSFQHALQRCRR